MSDSDRPGGEDHPIRRFKDGHWSSLVDPVIREQRIELDVNDGQARIAMLCLPRDLEALAVGFLLGEGALRDRQDFTGAEYLPDEHKLAVSGTFDAEALENINIRWTWGTGCGGGGTSRDIDRTPYAPVAEGPTVTPEQLIALGIAFHGRSDLWRSTGGVHTCALTDREHLLVEAEDVGRHNAFDKVMGMAVLSDMDVSDKLILTTGRLSAEIVSKAVACGVTVLVSRSAVTNLAVALAKRFGVTLVGFLRGRRLNVYTGFQRIASAG